MDAASARKRHLVRPPQLIMTHTWGTPVTPRLELPNAKELAVTVTAAKAKVGEGLTLAQCQMCWGAAGERERHLVRPPQLIMTHTCPGTPVTPRLSSYPNQKS